MSISENHHIGDVIKKKNISTSLSCYGLEKPSKRLKSFMRFVLFSVVLLLLSSSCQQDGHAVAETQNVKQPSGEKMELVVGSHSFEIQISNTDAAKELAAMLPLTLSMSELNGNEKYANLSGRLTSRTEKVGKITAGDVMLWGNDCLVIFYKSFDTPYSYTRIGRIGNPSKLADALGKGGVTVTFQAVSKPQKE